MVGDGPAVKIGAAMDQSGTNRIVRNSIKSCGGFPVPVFTCILSGLHSIWERIIQNFPAMQEENEKKLELFSDRLRGMRASRGLTQSELAAHMEVSIGAVGNWESRQNIPTGPTLRKLADFFQTPLGYLLGETENREAEERGLVRTAPEGKGTALQEGGSFYSVIEGELPNLSEDPQAFWLEWFGDSMEPRILAGDKLLVSPNANVEDGDLVMVKKVSGEIAVRIYVAGKPGMFTLVAYNRIYPRSECRREECKWIYAVICVLRTTKLRGLYRRPAATAAEGTGANDK
jgi:transcriptional regulator with XRE-family HTH domain